MKTHSCCIQVLIDASCKKRTVESQMSLNVFLTKRRLTKALKPIESFRCAAVRSVSLEE